MKRLRSLFVRFLRARHFTRHFVRRLMLETVARAPGAARQALPAGVEQRLRLAAQLNEAGLFDQFDSHADGLSDPEVEGARDRFGTNEVEHEKPLPWWRHLWHCYRNPFNLLLTVLATVSYFTEDIKAMIVIVAMVALSTLLRFIQEDRSNRAAERLKAMVSTTATVMRRDLGTEAAEVAARFFDARLSTRRPPRQFDVPMRDLVPGDLVVLSAGDMVPADCRLLSAKDLFVSQSAMTGESLPVEKFATPFDCNGSVLESPNLVFMGTNVVSGSARALVVTTGNRTYFGTLATRMTVAERAPTSFEAGVNSVAWLLIRFAFVMVPFVLIVNGVTKNDWIEAFLFALSVAVGLTPEMLPMIVTSTLAKGAVLLSRKKVIVKRLDAIQNFGAMDVLCTDKTGTLTQDRIVLAHHTDVFGNESVEVLKNAYLNSYYQTGLKNLLDRAVLEHAELQDELHLAQEYRKIDEVPFDFQRRRMSVVVSEREHHHELICKGAVEEILAVCSRVRMPSGDDGPLDAYHLAEVRRVTGELNEQGLRVVAVAMRELPATEKAYGVADEASLTLIGYIAFLDPPKDSAFPALQALAEHGVRVKVLTGDSELVTAEVCRQVKLPVGRTMLGADIDRMDDVALSEAVTQHDVFAKLAPHHKERIVRALRARGSVVGFMGDGINDAPALRAADIGISVDSAVDIAKEAADIILLEKSLMVLEEGVLEGRRTFSNMLKYIRMTASSNFGNVFSVLIASAFLPFLPMLPLQLLVQNLLYDISQVAIPFDNVDAELVRSPLRWNPADIGRFMLVFGPISSLFDLMTYALMWFVFGANTLDTQSLFQSGWFVEGLLTQTLIVHMIRTPHIPFIESRPAAPLLLTTLAIMAIGVFLPMSPVADYFKLQPLPLAYWPCLLAILVGYMALTTGMKRVYIRRFGWQ